MEERRGRRGWTSPGEEISNETGKLVIAHGSVELFEATPFDLAYESKEFSYGRETDRDLRSVCRCVACLLVVIFSPNEQRGGWGGGGGGAAILFPFVLFSLFSRPRTGFATV